MSIEALTPRNHEEDGTSRAKDEISKAVGELLLSYETPIKRVREKPELRLLPMAASIQRWNEQRSKMLGPLDRRKNL